MKRQAFTLVEILVSMAILLVIAAICYPVFQGAVKRSKQTVSASNLHQLWMAIEIYRQDYPENSATNGTPDQMGLPPADAYGEILQHSNLKPPYQGPQPLLHPYIYYPPDPGYAQQILLDLWAAWSRACKDNTILLGDFNFNDFYYDTFNPYLTVHGIGVTVGGQLLNKRKRGNIYSPAWWSCPQQEDRIK